MPSLMGNDPDPTGVFSLLGPALSGGAAQDPTSSLAAFLAAGGAMANAGAPTLGPPPTTAQAILGALGAGRNAAIQQNMVPYLQQQAAMQQTAQLQALQTQQLDYTIKKFQFDRQQAYQNLWKQGVGAPAGAAAPAAGADNESGTSPPASADLASLPDVAALPDQTRVPALTMMRSVGMGPAEASHYARMLMAESGGQHLDPKTGEVVRGDAGDTGVAQVIPGTFADMAKLHGINGSITDLMPNLLAGGNYFHDQVLANGGDLRAATIAYNMGPQGLQDVLSGKRMLPTSTQDYLARTNAPPALPQGVQFAGPGAPGAPPAVAPPPAPSGAPPAGAPPPAPSGAPPAGAPSGATGVGGADPLVRDPMSGAMVPQSILRGAFAAGGSDPTNGPAAHAKFIDDYLLKKSLMPTYAPTGTSGVQRSSQGETSTAPTGTVTEVAPTDAERKAMFPNVPSWQDILLKKDQRGNVIGHEFPEMGPEPMTPISDTQAQLPNEQGGAGASYRPGTAYAVGARTGLVKPIQIERGAGPPTAGGPGGAPLQTPGELAVQQQQFSQQMELENQVRHSPIYTQWNQGASKFDGVFAGLNQGTRAGDQAAIESLAKIFDPSAVVTEGKLAMSSTYGGIAQTLQDYLGRMTGESGLPDSVRQQIGNLAIAEMKTRDAAVAGQIEESRASAQSKGVDPTKVMPRFNSKALYAGDDEAQNLPAGVQLAQPKVFQNSKWVTQTAPAGAAPGAAPAVAGGTPSQPGATVQPLPVPPPGTLQGLSKEGFRNLAKDMQANPGRYSPDYQAAIKTELGNRLRNP